MGVDVTITQKGLFKKTLPLEVLLGSKLKYGRFDGLRLIEGELGEEGFVAYQPDRLARGIGIDWNAQKKDSVYLRLPFPSTLEETDAFYDLIQRIKSHWTNCKVDVDGTVLNEKELDESRKTNRDFSLKVLKNFCNDEEKESLTIFCALWPLVLGEKEKARFREAEDLKDFSDYLHNMQAIDVYYAKPAIYKRKEDFIGMFAITETTPSIIPASPKVPFGLELPDTGKESAISDWYVTLVALSDEQEPYIVNFTDFMNALPADKLNYYDAENVLLKELSLDEIVAIGEKYRVEL